MRNLKRALSLALASVMVLGLMIVGSNAMTADFGDADQIDEQYSEAIDVLSTIGLFDGMNDDANSFEPVGTLTRAQAAKLLTVMRLGADTAESLDKNTQIFQDVPKGNWAAGFIAYCNSVGILAGNGDGTFSPDGKLTGVQFGKMLLVALGYDADIEGYVNNGSAWEINVATDMIEAGIDVDDISFSDPITREQAAQMVFNTIKAPMVKYNSNNSLEYLTTTIAAENTISRVPLTNTVTNRNGGYTVEFGEKYFPELVFDDDDSDEFGRPAYTWIYKNEDIATYIDTDKLVASYTTSVTGGTIYNAIGSVAAQYPVSYIIDGESMSPDDVAEKIKKNNKDDIDHSGPSVLTEVYVKDRSEYYTGELTIVQVNTYLAEATDDYSTKKEALPIEIKGKLVTGTTAPKNVYLEDVSNIENYIDGNFILVQVANGVVVEVINPEKLSDVSISRFSAVNSWLSYVVSGGTQYNSNVTLDFFPKGDKAGRLDDYNKSQLKDSTYNLYLDQYGNLAGAEVVNAKDQYLFLVGYDLNSSSLATTTADAAVIFTDGTMSTVKLDITKSNDTDHLGETPNPETLAVVDATGSSLKGVSAQNRWYKYTVKDGVYTLKKADQVEVLANSSTPDLSVEDVRVTDSTNSNLRGYGNDDTIYITVDSDEKGTDTGAAITKVNGTYPGAQNVNIEVSKTGLDWPNDHKNNQDNGFDQYVDIQSSIWALIDKDNYIIAAVVRGENKGSSARAIVYGLKGAQYEEYNKEDDCYYWTFEAAVDGKIETLTVKTDYNDVIEKIKGVIPTTSNSGLDHYISNPNTTFEGALLRVTYDSDGNVTNAVVLNDSSSVAAVYGANEYSNTASLTDRFDAYLINYKKADFTNGVELHATANTLQTDEPNDVGVTVVNGAPVVVIQRNNAGDKLTIEEYSSVSSALKNVANSDKFLGTIAAGLNERGTAAWLVIENVNKEEPTGKPSTSTDEPTSSDPGYLKGVKVSVDSTTGKIKADITLNTPGYNNTDYTLDVEFFLEDDGVQYSKGTVEATWNTDTDWSATGSIIQQNKYYFAEVSVIENSSSEVVGFLTSPREALGQ